MKTDTSAVVDARTGAIEFLDGDEMDEQRLIEAMHFINAERDGLSIRTYARLCERVAWHLRQIGQYHQHNAEVIERANRHSPAPFGPSLLRDVRHEAQETFELADSWARSAVAMRRRGRGVAGFMSSRCNYRCRGWRPRNESGSVTCA